MRGCILHLLALPRPLAAAVPRRPAAGAAHRVAGEDHCHVRGHRGGGGGGEACSHVVGGREDGHQLIGWSLGVRAARALLVTAWSNNVSIISKPVADDVADDEIRLAAD